MHPIKFAYFGGEPLAVPILDILKEAGLPPSLVIANPDRPTGRKQILTPPPAKAWAEAEGIPVFQPTTYKGESVKTFLTEQEWDAFVVVAYNFILPAWLLTIPKHQVINVHPSMLPLLRGASPIRSAILKDEPEAVGATIMLIDEKMDHGPILAQEKLAIDPSTWPISGPELDQKLATLGGELLTKTLPAWVSGGITPQEQSHENATYCPRLEKNDSEVTLDPKDLPHGTEAKKIWHKINAFAGIGDTFFRHEGSRVKIKQAALTKDGSLALLRVIPEGKKETDFTNYVQSLR